VVSSIKDAMAEAKAKKMKNRGLIHNAFPEQASPIASHLGSQSASPMQGGNYPDPNAGGQMPDRMDYNQ
jgi:hypothetical protein